MDFSLTTMFVLPPGSALPAAGSTEDLVAKQLGVFNADYTLATAAAVAAQPYIYLAQGRLENVPHTGSKRSGKIAKNKAGSWYTVKPEPDLVPQATVVSGFHIKCGEQVNVTVRAHSNYIDAGFYNGYTQSVTVDAPCCDCGADPCAEIDATDQQAMVDKIIEKFAVNGPFMGGVLSSYIEMYRSGEGAASQLVIVGKPILPDGRIADTSANPWEYDRLWYQVFVYKTPPTTQDRIVYDRCDPVATVVTTSASSFVRGSADEIRHLEMYYYSYQTPMLKTLVDMPGYNGAYESYVVDGLFYDTYYLKFGSVDDTHTWDNTLPQDESVILAIPAGEGAPLIALLTAYLGAPLDRSPANRVPAVLPVPAP